MSLGACEMETNNTMKKEQKTETTLHLDAITLKMQYDIYANTFAKNIADIEDLKADKRIEGANSLKWILGHTLDIQFNLGMLTGQIRENPYAEQFGFGKLFNPKGNYPSIKQMIADWDRLSPIISAAIGNMTKEKLDVASPIPLPISEQTIRGLLAFQMHHLGYEFGQIGLYRKFLEKSSFTY